MKKLWLATLLATFTLAHRQALPSSMQQVVAPRGGKLRLIGASVLATADAGTLHIEDLTALPGDATGKALLLP